MWALEASVLQGISKLLWRCHGHSNWAIPIRSQTGGLKLAIHALNSRALLRLSPLWPSCLLLLVPSVCQDSPEQIA